MIFDCQDPAHRPEVFNKAVVQLPHTVIMETPVRFLEQGFMWSFIEETGKIENQDSTIQAMLAEMPF